MAFQLKVVGGHYYEIFKGEQLLAWLDYDIPDGNYFRVCVGSTVIGTVFRPEDAIEVVKLFYEAKKQEMYYLNENIIEMKEDLKKVLNYHSVKVLEEKIKELKVEMYFLEAHYLIKED